MQKPPRGSKSTTSDEIVLAVPAPLGNRRCPSVIREPIRETIPWMDFGHGAYRSATNSGSQRRASGLAVNVGTHTSEGVDRAISCKNPNTPGLTPP